MLAVMEPQDSPPYAPLPGDEPVSPRPSDTAAATSRSSTSPARDDAARTRRNVAVATAGAFLAAMAGMAIARSGSSSASTTTTSPASPGVTAPQRSVDDDDDGFTFDEPRAAQPGSPTFDGGGRTQSRGS